VPQPPPCLRKVDWIKTIYYKERLGNFIYCRTETSIHAWEKLKDCEIRGEFHRGGGKISSSLRGDEMPHGWAQSAIIMFQMLGATAQLERSLIAERVKAGLDHARKNGVLPGRPALRKLTNKEIAQFRRERVGGKLPYRILPSKFGVSVWTAHTPCGSSKQR